MIKYRIRKGSLAYYLQKTWKPLTVLAAVTLMTGCMVTCTEAMQKELTEPVAVMAEELAEEIPQTWDIPLDENLQIYVAELCEDLSIEPELVFAMIEKESQWNPYAIGDNGESAGLMQVQDRWHSERMKKLGCTDLFDPYENVTVGIDILAEKLNKYDSEGEALTAYNAGDRGANDLYFSKGIYANDYALKVIERAEELKAGE